MQPITKYANTRIKRTKPIQMLQKQWCQSRLTNPFGTKIRLMDSPKLPNPPCYIQSKKNLMGSDILQNPETINRKPKTSIKKQQHKSKTKETKYKKITTAQLFNQRSLQAAIDSANNDTQSPNQQQQQQISSHHLKRQTKTVPQTKIPQWTRINKSNSKKPNLSPMNRSFLKID